MSDPDEGLDLGPIDPGTAAGEPRAQGGSHPWAPSEFDRRERKPYELVDEDGGVRTYVSPDGTLVQVKSQIRGQRSTVGAESYNIEEMRDRVEAMTRAQLAAWFADEGDDLGYEAFGPQSGEWHRWEDYEYVWDEAADGVLADEDGDPIIATDQHGVPITITYWSYLVEQAFWPPAPHG